MQWQLFQANGQYLIAKNSHYDTFYPKLKRGLAKIPNFSFSVKCIMRKFLD